MINDDGINDNADMSKIDFGSSNIKSVPSKTAKKIPYRTITFIDLEPMLDKYKGLSNRDIAIKLMVDEGLKMLRKVNEPITTTDR